MRVLIIVLCTALGGCGTVARIESRDQYKQSLASYRSCLAANAPQACESQRIAMEADERAFNNLSDRAVNYNVLQR